MDTLIRVTPQLTVSAQGVDSTHTHLQVGTLPATISLAYWLAATVWVLKNRAQGLTVRGETHI